MKMAEIEKTLTAKDETEILTTPPELLEKALKLGEEQVKSSLFASLKAKLQQKASQLKDILRPIPVWGYGLSVAIITSIIFFIFYPSSSTIKIFPVGNQLIITPDTRDMTAEVDTVEYVGMQVILSDDKASLIFQWPIVKDAENYDMHIYKNGIPSRLTPAEGIRETHFNIALDELQLEKNIRYTWQISGKLTTGASFYARSGFEWRK